MFGRGCYPVPRLPCLGRAQPSVPLPPLPCPGVTFPLAWAFHMQWGFAKKVPEHTVDSGCFQRWGRGKKSALHPTTSSLGLVLAWKENTFLQSQASD